MGRYEEYFCMCSVPDTLLCIGIWMSMLNLIAATAEIYFYMLSDDMISFFATASTFVVVAVYLLTAGTHCCLVQIEKSISERFYTRYSIIIKISILFAFIDGIQKGMVFGIGGAISYFIVGIFGCFALCMTYCGKEELNDIRQAIFIELESGQVRTVVEAVGSGHPKFNAPIRIDNVEIRDNNFHRDLEVY